MISDFPESIASLLFDSYDEEHEQTIRRTDFERGPARQAPTNSLGMRFISVKYHVCSKESYKEFLRWFQEDTKRGALWFNWRDPIFLKYVRARIVEGKLSARPIESSLDKWELSFQLEVHQDFSEI